MMEFWKNKGAALLQFLKFGLVGVSNTLITAVVIALLLKVCRLPDLPANIIGYVAGLVNSFVWNRRWTFASTRMVWDAAWRFVLTFAVCYAVQLGVLWLLLARLDIDPYWCHLMGMAVYTVLNFLLNKLFTFKDK